jgi:tetratricopeptide (TPR) repeat protein
MKFPQIKIVLLLSSMLAACSANEFERGNDLYAQKDYAAAVASYTNYIDTHPKDAPSYFNRARALEEQGRLEEAHKDYALAAKLDPYNPSFRMGSGMCSFRLEKYNQAIIDMNEVLKLDSRSADAYYIKGVALIKKGEVRSAMESYDNAIRYDKNHAGAYLQRGILKGLSEKGDPCQDLQRAKNLGEEKADSALQKYCS